MKCLIDPQQASQSFGFGLLVPRLPSVYQVVRPKEGEDLPKLVMTTENQTNAYASRPDENMTKQQIIVLGFHLSEKGSLQRIIPHIMSEEKYE